MIILLLASKPAFSGLLINIMACHMLVSKVLAIVWCSLQAVFEGYITLLDPKRTVLEDINKALYSP